MEDKKRRIWIFVIVFFLVLATILGLILTSPIFPPRCGHDYSTEVIDNEAKGEIIDLFGSKDTNIIIKLGNQNTAKVRQGTQNFGIPIGFSPVDPDAWGNDNKGCKYSIIKMQDNCEEEIGLGGFIISNTKNVEFEQIENNVGYSLIKMTIPKNAPLCLIRFSVNVTCTNYPKETATSHFDVEIIKRRLFC
jgi:hypothetical protein